jgi:hypothetical protein
MALELLPSPPLSNQLQCTSILCTIVFHLLNKPPYMPIIITNGKLLPLLPLCKNLHCNKSYGLPIIVCHSWNETSYSNQRLPNIVGSLLIHHFVAFLLPFCNFLLLDTICIISGWKWRKLQKGYKDVVQMQHNKEAWNFSIAFFLQHFFVWDVLCMHLCLKSQVLVFIWNLNFCTILIDYGVFVGWSYKFQKLLRLHCKTKGLGDATSSFPMMPSLYLWTWGNTTKKRNECNLLPILNFQKCLSLVEMKVQVRYPLVVDQRTRMWTSIM